MPLKLRYDCQKVSLFISGFQFLGSKFFFRQSKLLVFYFDIFQVVHYKNAISRLIVLLNYLRRDNQSSIRFLMISKM